MDSMHKSDAGYGLYTFKLEINWTYILGNHLYYNVSV